MHVVESGIGDAAARGRAGANPRPMPVAAAQAPSGAPGAAAPFIRLRRRDRAELNRAAWRRVRRHWAVVVQQLARELVEARRQRPELTAQEWLADR